MMKIWEISQVQYHTIIYHYIHSSENISVYKKLWLNINFHLGRLITETTELATGVGNTVVMIPEAAQLTHKVDINCKMTRKGLKYKGYVNITTNGIQCQHWTAQHPHMYVILYTKSIQLSSMLHKFRFC